MFNCLCCGEEMVFVDFKEMDTDVKSGKTWTVEEWECLECEKKERIEMISKITSICRNY